jgi:site-specific DNA-methyltransferase (adenine-specific)
VVLDPFAGTSVTGIAAIRNGRDYVGLDLSRSYLVEHSRERLRGVVTAVQEKMTL